MATQMAFPKLSISKTESAELPELSHDERISPTVPPTASSLGEMAGGGRLLERVHSKLSPSLHTIHSGTQLDKEEERAALLKQ